jgi:excisionase family DNA binding protein
VYERRYLSPAQLQHELDLPADVVSELIHSGRLPAFRIGGRWRIDRRRLEQFVDQLTEEAAAEPHLVVDTNDARGTHFTDKQYSIIRLVGEGMSNAEIADHLSVEISTVKSHVSRILQRYDLRDREQLIAHAWRNGLMEAAAGQPESAPQVTA